MEEIIFKSDDKLDIGEFVNVKITGCDGYDLIGEKVWIYQIK